MSPTLRGLGEERGASLHSLLSQVSTTPGSPRKPPFSEVKPQAPGLSLVPSSFPLAISPFLPPSLFLPSFLPLFPPSSRPPSHLFFLPPSSPVPLPPYLPLCTGNYKAPAVINFCSGKWVDLNFIPSSDLQRWGAGGRTPAGACKSQDTILGGKGRKLKLEFRG